MRTRVIWVVAAVMVLWMLLAGVSLMVDFERIAQSNQVMTELEWTFLCGDEYGDYAEISVIEGGNHFIGESYSTVEYVIIDETGKELSETYHYLESLGNGYVRFEVTTPGVVLDENENGRVRMGVLNDGGDELPEKESLQILEEGLGGRQEERGVGNYIVKKSDNGRYAGLMSSAGRWIIPPVFDRIELTADQKYALIQNSRIFGIAKLEEQETREK